MQQRKRKLIANNKKARHDYFILETYEAGIVLTGTEIKSIRQGKVNLKESYVKVGGGQAVIHGMHISPYDHGNIFNVDPLRDRKLLLHKKEILKIEQKMKEKGLTVVPLSLYINEDGRAKLEIALAKGKKLYDKRDDIARKDAARRMQRESRRS
ncbi:MAG: SsrA-binding protein SmpB [Firmicutes bacterium]|nr:SsrA-binding protein SmpB [Bacillota bacterium]